ncbi:hypothetical protein H0V99_01820 [Candidatus Saccharibacteria bacterium]|nr:hypothetical protein [Candidatus Saccharibacteria bacterium]
MKYAALLILAFLQVLLSITLSYKKQSRTSRWFTIFTITLGVWTFFNVLLDYNQYQARSSVELLSLLNNLGFFTGSLALLCVYRLTLIFPLVRKPDKQSKLITFVGLLLPFVTLNSAVSGSFSYDSPGQTATYIYGKYVFIVGLFSLIVVGLCLINVFRVYKRSVDLNTKRQATTLFTGMLATVIFAIIFITIIPALIPSQEQLVFIGYFAPYIFTGVLLYSIFRQRFLNFRSIVARSVAYISSLGIMSALYVFVVFYLINKVFFHDDPVSLRQGFAFVLVAMFLALTFSKIQKFFDKVSNKLFFRDAYDSQVFIDKLNSILVGTIDVGAIGKKSAELIENTLQASFVQFLLAEKEGVVHRYIGSSKNSLDNDIKSVVIENFNSSNIKVSLIEEAALNNKKLYTLLDKNDISVIVKLVTRQQKIGFLLLGGKKSGNGYNAQDLQLFGIIADQLAIAIQNALRFEEIATFNITLQQKVTDATKELRKTNEKLKALDEAKDEFISMASHQLRTPLTSVKGYVSMVLEGDAGKLNEQQEKLLNQAFTSSQRMVYLIADLLNVSRLRTGKFVIEAKPTDLPEVIEGEIQQLKETAKARGLELTYSKPSSFPMLKLDETKIRQVVMNFVDNAIYYTPTGGHIAVNLTHTDKSVEFTVVDNGLGVPKDEQHHLFSKFYRADNAKKARPDGTGLGLFMARKVVIAQGGAIIFESQEGKGSTFGFTFPRHGLEA